MTGKLTATLARLLKNKNGRQNDRGGERGNIFVVLFASIVALGLLSVSVNNLLQGPITKSMETNREVSAIAAMMTGMPLIVAASVDPALPNSGDCDDDGFKEPLTYRNASPRPAGGGQIPSRIGSAKTDPWGTPFGYCVWDHGSEIQNTSECTDATLRLEGVNNNIGPARTLVLISAGPNRDFDVSCQDFATADANTNGVLDGTEDLINISSVSDDIIFSRSYDEAAKVSGGLWRLDPSDPNTATTNKNIETAGRVAFGDSASFDGSDDEGVVEANRGIVIGSYDLASGSDIPTCNPTNEGLIVHDNSAGEDTLKLCDPVASPSWKAISGSTGTTLDDISCADGKVLQYDGSSWICADESGGGDTLSDLGCTNGQVVDYKSSAPENWECTDGVGSTDTSVLGDRVQTDNTTASGNFSTALGYGTVASGSHSAALGNNTQATGIGSFAMGTGTEANGDQSVALGANSIADGHQSVAMGNNTHAVGQASFAMGRDSTAGGDYSIAFGNSTNASGPQSVAMGNGTTASGANSFAAGLTTTASGDQSLAMGHDSQATGEYSVAFGNNTEATASGAFAVGYMTNATGLQSAAFGNESTASGAQSAAMGNRTNATGDYSFTAGQDTDARGHYSFAMGNDADTATGALGAVALGKDTRANGTHSFAVGRSSMAGGDYAAAFNKATASGNGSVAFSQGTASGTNSFASGYNTQAKKPQSAAFGSGSVADGNQALAMGNSTTASGANSFAAGYNTTASGSQSIAWINGISVSGDNSFGVGLSGGSVSASNVMAVMGGNLGVGLENADERLHVDGNIRLEGTDVSSSDRRLKQNIRPLAKSLDKISRINGVSYRWKDPEKDDRPHLGLIAQNVEKVYPDTVKNGPTHKSVDYNAFIAPLIESVKALRTENDALYAEAEKLAASELAFEKKAGFDWAYGQQLAFFLALIAMLFLTRRYERY